MARKKIALIGGGMIGGTLAHLIFHSQAPLKVLT
jgi:malate/lactate dehydrogenase